MDTTSLSTQILSTLRTSKDVHNVEDTLDVFTNQLFSIKTQNNDEAFSTLPHTIANILKQEFSNQSGSERKREELQKKLEELKKSLHEAKTIQITLSFEPTEKFLETLSSWIKKELGQNTLFDLEINPQILGGAIIITEGLYKDYSLRQKIASVFEKQPEKIQLELA